MGMLGNRARTRRRENRKKFGPVLPVVAQTATIPDTEVSRTKQYTRSPHAQFREVVTDGHGVVFWNGLFIIPIGSGDSLRDGLLVKNEIEERQVRFIGVRGCVLVWGERRRTTNATQQKVKESKTRRENVGVLTCSRCWG